MVGILPTPRRTAFFYVTYTGGRLVFDGLATQESGRPGRHSAQ
jgi:hypothetical protein